MKYTKVITTTASVLLLAGTSMAQTSFTPGVLRHQMWSSANTLGRANPSRVDIENGLAGVPDTDNLTDLTAFQTVEEQGTDYGERVSGLFIPPTTGKYVFMINSDDDSDLFLNPNGASPAGKVLIAQESGWSNPLNWNSVGGGSDVNQKRSDKFKNAGNVSPFKDGIQLTAGQKYWIEAVHHEGSGGDNLAATFFMFGGSPPANSTASALTGNVIGYGYTIPTSLTVLRQVTNTTAYAGTEASFTFVVENPLPDPLDYQWYKNDVIISNAIGSSYTFLATPADSGATFKCEVKIPASYGSSLKVTSATGTLTVNPLADSAILPGFLKAETFPYASREQIEDGNVAASTNIFVTPTFELPVDKADNYGRRVSGYFIPPVSGKYVFFVASDDDSDVFLSTDANPSNKRKIAHQEGWSASRNWNTPAPDDAANPLAYLKRSDRWSPDDGVTTPYAAGIDLVAGQNYYIEAVHHEGTGGDDLGVTYKLVGDPDPADGTATKIGGSNIAAITTPSQTITFKTQPATQTVFDQQTASFTVAATGNGELTPIYQWYRTQNGTTTMITNAVDANYRFTADVAKDHGAQFFVVAQSSVAATSQVATLTVQQAVFEPGLLKVEFWQNQTRAAVEAGTVPDPDWVSTARSFDLGAVNDNYTRRVSGLFLPPSSGKYVFFLASDDDTDLYLSTDATPANKKLIAQEAGWASGQRTWNTAGGGGSLTTQMRSDQWSPDSGTTIPWASGIQLNQGTKYYLEAVQHNGSGGNYVGVTFIKVGETDPVDGDATKLTGNTIGFNAPAASYIAFSQQPQSVTATPGTTATFKAVGVSDSPISIGGNNNDKVMYQWYKDGAVITNATGSSYTTPVLTAADLGTHSIYAAIRALGIASWSNSATATLTVSTDTAAPTISSASTLTLNSNKYVSITFNERMDAASLQNATYSVAGATVGAITVNTNSGTSVTLQITGTPTGAVTVTGAKDFSGNTIAAGASMTIANFPLVSQDVGVEGDPAYPSMVWVQSTNAFTVMAEGSDIWNNADGFNFCYEQKTGDFDVAVRQKSITHTSNWAKGGLMVRETLQPGSRNWNIINDPLPSDGISAPDNSGMGAGLVEANSRVSTDGASADWDSNRQAPTYPNAWVRLTRVGQVISAYASTNGVDWTLRASADPSAVGDATPLPATVYVGTCTTAHNNDTVGADPLLYYNTVEYADYSSKYVPAAPAPTLTLSKEGTAWKITYTGTLESSATADGGYTTVQGATSPYTIDTSTGSKFFRARQ